MCNELRATAYHEAGHAVAAVLLGVELIHVSIIPARDSLGRYSRGGRCPPLDRRYGPATNHALLLVDLAGLAAQRLVDPEAPDRHGRHDEEGHVEIRIGYRQRRADHVAAWKAARAAVLALWRQQAAVWAWQHRRQIRTVAEALLERRELTGEEVREIVQKARRKA